MQELGTSRRLSCLTPMSRMRLCLLRELLKEGVLIRDILLGFRMSHQVDSEPTRPPGLDVGPFSHELDVMFLVATRETDVLTEMMGGGIH